MTFSLYTEAALARDFPEHGLHRGDLVRVLDHHVAPDGEEGYSVEVLGVKEQTIAVIAVPASAVEALGSGLKAHLRNP